MMKTEGAEKMRREYAAGGCESGSGSYGTFAAYWESARRPWNGTQVQVGGFSYEFRSNGDGTVTYTIRNKLTKESWFYHMYDIPLAGGALRVLVPYLQNKPERGGLFPFMGDMTQYFEWTEPNP